MCHNYVKLITELSSGDQLASALCIIIAPDSELWRGKNEHHLID